MILQVLIRTRSVPYLRANYSSVLRIYNSLLNKFAEVCKIQLNALAYPPCKGCVCVCVRAHARARSRACVSE
jgi:hypothetical protein